MQRSSISSSAIKMSSAEKSCHYIILTSLVLQSKTLLQSFFVFSRGSKFLNSISRPVRTSHVMIMRHKSSYRMSYLINVRVSLRYVEISSKVKVRHESHARIVDEFFVGFSDNKSRIWVGLAFVIPVLCCTF